MLCDCDQADESESEPEVIYDSERRSDPASALDVLAFVLTPVSVFTVRCPEDTEATAELLREAKAEMVQRWLAQQGKE